MQSMKNKLIAETNKKKRKNKNKNKNKKKRKNKKVSSTYICDEILFSILSKLPLKSLKRFECVQKSWSLLFENHHFMNMFRKNFLSYNDPASLILSVDHEYNNDFYYFSGEKFENKVKFDWFDSAEVFGDCTLMFGFGSINGILCLRESDNEGGNKGGEIVLWNPTTQTINILPPSDKELSVQDKYADLDNFYVLFKFYIHGFGYDHITNDYMVIRFVLYPANSECLDDKEMWEIYSLKSNLWRKLRRVDMPYSLEYTEGSQVYMDGVCHWLCERYNTVGPCLVSFYLSNEKFFITPLPFDVDECFDFNLKKTWINLAVLNGFIALISLHKETTTFHISILGEFYTKESWTKLLVVGPLSCIRRPIKVGTKGEIFFLRKDGELVWLDLSTQIIAEIGYNEEEEGDISQIMIYKE